MANHLAKDLLAACPGNPRPKSAPEGDAAAAPAMQFRWALSPDGAIEVLDGREIFAPIQLNIHPEELCTALTNGKRALAEGRRYEADHRLCDTRGNSRRFALRADRAQACGHTVLTGTLSECLADTEATQAREREARKTIESLLAETRRRLEEQKQAIQDVEIAREKAVRTAQLKAEFLATVSHEIRTPLNGVIGMTDLLLGSDLSPEQRDHAEVLRLAAESLLSVINDVLDFSKIEAGKMRVEREVFDPARTAREASDLLAVRAAEKGLALHCEVAENETVLALGDAPRLRQVLVNLIGNAVKFTHEGSIHVTATMERDENSGIRARFEVRDTGVGIEPEQLPRLFEEFTQVGGAAHRETEGTGLGLAISRKLVTLMGGQIDASSIPGQGSMFSVTLTLPLAGDQEQARPENQDQELSRRLAANPPRILVAEDNPVNQRLIHAQLARLGCTADVVSDGQAAAEAARNDDYDVILMDCRMPVLDGFQATDRIRRAERADRHTWIIAMTANALEGDRENCLAAGMDDYVAKPIQLGDLAPALERSLDRNGCQTKGSEEAPPHQEQETLCGEVLDALRDEFVETDDLDEFHHILDLYIRNARRNCEAARDALARTDMQALGLAAHSLKGSSGSIGAARLSSLSGRLEALADGRADCDPRELLAELQSELGRVEIALSEATG